VGERWSLLMLFASCIMIFMSLKWSFALDSIKYCPFTIVGVINPACVPIPGCCKTCSTRAWNSLLLLLVYIQTLCFQFLIFQKISRFVTVDFCCKISECPLCTLALLLCCTETQNGKMIPILMLLTGNYAFILVRLWILQKLTYLLVNCDLFMNWLIELSWDIINHTDNRILKFDLQPFKWNICFVWKIKWIPFVLLGLLNRQGYNS